MNKKQLGQELIAQLNLGFDIVKISRWAHKINFENIKNIDSSMHVILQTLFSMEDDLQFEYTENELRMIANNLINNDENPFRKIAEKKSKEVN
ncbi:MAG: hypothetical protein H0W88_04690 [Parachlamydiaceae bacterium]|nr:hypothetical protein [Parachlamydiaceae bacterium]